MKLRFIFLIVLSSLVSAKDAAEYQTERFTKTLTIDQPTTLKVINKYGDIRIRKADDNQFIYHGVAQAKKNQAFNLEFTQENHHITAVVNFENPDHSAGDGRFDLALITPDLMSLDIEIERGALTSKGLNNHIKAKSNDSMFQLKTSGEVDLFTKTGSIELILNNEKVKNHSKIQTHSGAVTLKYNATAPFVGVITGNYVSSNSAKLLNSLSLDKRIKNYGDEDATKHVQITTDTGAVRIIDVSR